MTDPATVAATLEAFVRATGAEGASALIAAGVVEVDDEGSASFEPTDSPMAEPLDPRDGEPLDLGLAVRKLPPFRVTAETGEVSAPMGALEHLAEGIRAVAAAIGGNSVALVRFPATDGETPFALAARQDEGLVVVIGDEQYEMGAEWPGPISC